MITLILFFSLIYQIDTLQLRELKLALEDAGENRIALMVAIKEIDHRWRDDLIWLIIKMPHLDRLEIKKKILIENVEFAHRAFSRWNLPDSLFRDYVLPYRFAEEPILPWRKIFYERFDRLTESDIKTTVYKINKVVAHELELAEKKDFFGPDPSPLHLLFSKTVTKEQAGILFGAALRSIGIPIRFISCPYLGEEKGGATWIEFYDGNNWLPAYPLNPEGFADFKFYEKGRPQNLPVVLAQSAFYQKIVTDNYTPCGYLKLNFTSKGLPQKRFENFSIAVLNDGAYQPLDDLIQYAEDPYLLTIGDGQYLFEAGVRNKKGNPYLQIRPIEIKPGETVNLTIDLDIPVKRLLPEEFIVRNLDSTLSLNFIDLKNKSYKFKDMIKDSPVIFFIFDLRTEPPKRMINLVAEFARGNKILTYGIYLDSLNQIKEDLAPSFIFLGGIRDSVISKLSIEEFPSTMLWVNRQLIYWGEGYNLNIKDELNEIFQRFK